MKALYLDVVNDIKNKIYNRDLKKGDKLPSERELALQFNVSRNVVREAITVLHNEGFVEVFPGRGTFITEPQLNIVSETIDRVMNNYNTTLEDIINVREGLEVYVIKNVIERATEEDIKSLYETYKLMEKNRANVEEFVKYDKKFHLQLAEYTKNPLYKILMHSFIEMTQSVLFDFTRLYPDCVIEAQEHHLEIINSIENRDESFGLKVIRTHVEVLRNKIKILRERKIIQ